jgi:hypothetical protein
MSQNKSFDNSPEHSTGQPTVRLSTTDSYREGYANSVQVRMSVWDFQLIFGTIRQDSADEVNLLNFQGIYISPQQAKALWNILGQNIAQYEQTFGKVSLEPQSQSTPLIIPVPPPGGAVN